MRMSNPPAIGTPLVIALLSIAPLLYAQTAPTPASTATQKPITGKATTNKPAQARHSTKAAQPQPVVVTPPPPPPPPPEMPHWPVNDKANAARITWDKQGLRVDADNSELKQILDDIAVATGAKLEGTPPTQRVYGTYGPGLARDVLAQLMNGTGYNVVMIGDIGAGAPKKIVLSLGQKGGAVQQPSQNQPTNNGDDTGENDPQQQPMQQPRPVPPVNPAYPRN